MMRAVSKTVGRRHHRALVDVLDFIPENHPQRSDLIQLMTLTQCCVVSGLGGHPYRDGSVDYYVNERVRENDAKATGPFITGCLYLGR